MTVRPMAWVIVSGYPAVSPDTAASGPAEEAVSDMDSEGEPQAVRANRDRPRAAAQRVFAQVMGGELSVERIVREVVR
ncbi:hypothetical protein GCM10009696_11140 [Kocuria himachalensis]